MSGQNSQHDVQKIAHLVPHPPARVHVGLGGPWVCVTGGMFLSRVVDPTPSVVVVLLLLVGLLVASVFPEVGDEVCDRLEGTLEPGQGGGQKLRVFAGPECVVPLMTVGSIKLIAGGTTLGKG